jgi:hypothetical protein
MQRANSPSSPRSVAFQYKTERACYVLQRCSYFLTRGIYSTRSLLPNPYRPRDICFFLKFALLHSLSHRHDRYIPKLAVHCPSHTCTWSAGASRTSPKLSEVRETCPIYEQIASWGSGCCTCFGYAPHAIFVASIVRSAVGVAHMLS